MSKESNFVIYCMERYRYYKRLSGAEVAKIFEIYDIFGYITKYFESLHTMGDRYIVQDIDDYISGLTIQDIMNSLLRTDDNIICLFYIYKSQISL